MSEKGKHDMSEEHYWPESQTTRTHGSVQNGFIIFFPGLGSRRFYDDAAMQDILSADPLVKKNFMSAADIIGITSAKWIELIPNAHNLKRLKGRVEKQNLINLACFIYNISVYDLYLRYFAEQPPYAVTGESLGILEAAVAANSISLEDGIRITRALTTALLPSSQLSSDTQSDSFIEQRFVEKERANDPIEMHVLGVTSKDSEALVEILDAIRSRFPVEDVQVHKRYSSEQANLYVSSERITDFKAFMKELPSNVHYEELKPPTSFTPHDINHDSLRQEFLSFLSEQNIRFYNPTIRMISNSGPGFVVDACAVKAAVLDIINKPMDSQATVATIRKCHPSFVIEMGKGNKSIKLFEDNKLDTDFESFEKLRENVGEMDPKREIAFLHDYEKRLECGDASFFVTGFDILRHAAALMKTNKIFKQMLGDSLYRFKNDTRAPISGILLKEPKPQNGISKFRQALTATIKAEAVLTRGEFAIRQRANRHTVDEYGKRRLIVRYTVIDQEGNVSSKERIAPYPIEIALVQFEPSISRDECDESLQLYRAIRQQYPEIFRNSLTVLGSSDWQGWLAVLQASGALTNEQAQLLRSASPFAERSKLLRSGQIHLPRANVPLVARIEKQITTDPKILFRETMMLSQIRQRCLYAIREGNSNMVNPETTVLCIQLGGSAESATVINSDNLVETIRIPDTETYQSQTMQKSLAAIDRRCYLSSSSEFQEAVQVAAKRNALPVNLLKYVHEDEVIIGFASGGSESMTSFVARDGEDFVRVRKVLSEALVSTRWDRNGQGPMLPPFAKAKRQVEYLQALPKNVKHSFPEILDTQERNSEIASQTPMDSEGQSSPHELSYDMTYIPGIEVSELVRTRHPSASTVAGLYRTIHTFLRDNVHSERTRRVTGDVLKESYFDKIRNRLELTRHTAPRTFGEGLLDSETIWINNKPYLNIGPILEKLEHNNDYMEKLEPKYLGLVMGDTNTENIKIQESNLALEMSLRDGEDPTYNSVNTANPEDFSPDAIGLRFLDPRAIGYRSTGAQTVDDYMYDNKPWHNSLGHYDEIHHELFSFTEINTKGSEPRIGIEYQPGNPYSISYGIHTAFDPFDKTSWNNPTCVAYYFRFIMRELYSSNLSLIPENYKADKHWLERFVFIMGTHFAAMPPYHFVRNIDGVLTDTPQTQRRPIAVYTQGIIWLNWSLRLLQGREKQFCGVPVNRK